MINVGIYNGDLIIVQQQNTANNGDIVVRNYSSNLPRIMSLDKTHIFVKLNHMKLTEFRFPLGEEHAKIFNIIRNLF